MNIINSIHLILAAGGEVELWHPKKLLYKVDSFFPQRSRIATYNWERALYNEDELEDCKIPRNSFAHLCRAVEANPVDNPAVRAFHHSKGLNGIIASVHLGAIKLRFPKDKKWTYSIEKDFSICAGESYFKVMPEFAISLLREGYPVGIPAEHWIDREKLEDQTDA